MLVHTPVSQPPNSLRPLGASAIKKRFALAITVAHQLRLSRFANLEI